MTQPVGRRSWVDPTADDPVVASLSEGVGGPVGTRAGRHRWWTPVRVILALTAICFALGMVQKSGCYKSTWQNDQARYTHMCYSDLPYLYTGRGFVELNWPYSDDEQVRARYEVMEYPVGISYWAWGTAWVTHWLNGSPDLSERYLKPIGDVSAQADVRREMRIFVIVNALGFAVLALLSAWLLAGVNPRRPWDAAAFALSPALLLTGLINWDMVAVVFVAGALWAWARDRPLLTGVLIGLGAATKLYPLFLLGGILVICVRQRRYRTLAVTAAATATAWVLANLPAYLSGPREWKVFWSFNTRPRCGPRVDLAGPAAGTRHDRRPVRVRRAHHQRRVLAVLRCLVRRRAAAGAARAGDPAAGAAGLPGGRGLPADQQGLLAAVRPLAAPTRGAGPAALARPDHLAGG